jgi:hypothetical protein
MAIGIYLGFNPPIPEVQLHSDGKLLGTHLEQLHRLAEIAGVPPLGSFMDQRVPEPASDYDMLDLDAFMASWEEWFSPSVGVRTVEGLLAVLRGPSNPMPLTEDAVYLPNHLEDLLRCLRLAESRGAQFRIEVAM